VKTSEAALGREHPQHLSYSINLAWVLAASNKRNEAIAIYQNIIPILKKVSGPFGYDTLAAIQNQAAILIELGKHSDAEPLLLEVFIGCQRTMGEGSEKTMLVIENIIQLYRAMKKDDKVREWQSILEAEKRKPKQ
jgi:hypothetical protein